MKDILAPAPTLAERIRARKIDPLDIKHPQHRDGSYIAGCNRMAEAAARTELDSARCAVEVAEAYDVADRLEQSHLSSDMTASLDAANAARSALARYRAAKAITKPDEESAPKRD